MTNPLSSSAQTSSNAGRRPSFCPKSSSSQAYKALTTTTASLAHVPSSFLLVQAANELQTSSTDKAVKPLSSRGYRVREAAASVVYLSSLSHPHAIFAHQWLFLTPY